MRERSITSIVSLPAVLLVYEDLIDGINSSSCTDKNVHLAVLSGTKVELYTFLAVDRVNEIAVTTKSLFYYSKGQEKGVCIITFEE